MSEILLSGYLVNEVSFIVDLETILFQMEKIVNDSARKSYEKLVSWQVERIVDEIALNRLKRPTEDSIFSLAVSEVRRRVLYADQHMQYTEFNFYMGVQILLGKIDEHSATFLKVSAPNNIYSGPLKKIPELIPYNITDVDLDHPKSQKCKFWNSIINTYAIDTVLACKLINYDQVFQIDPQSLKFRSIAERSADIAKEQILNQLLAAYGCDQQIQPGKLMEYSMLAFQRLTRKEIKEFLSKDQAKLETLLPEITHDLILARPCDTIL